METEEAGDQICDHYTMAAPTDGRMKGQMVDMQEIGPFNVSEIRAFGVMYCNRFK